MHDLDDLLSIDIPKQPRISILVLKVKLWAVDGTMEPDFGPKFTFDLTLMHDLDL